MGSLVYWMVGLSTNGGVYHYFIFLGILYCLQATMSMYFKVLAAAMPNINIAQPLSGVSVIFMVVFSGYIANTSFIPPWWIWFYYINPLSWALQAVAINEFSSGGFYDLKWVETDSKVIATVCQGVPLDATVGECFLDFYGFQSSNTQIIIAAGVLIGQYILFVCLSILCLDKLRHRPGVTGSANGRGEAMDSVVGVAPEVERKSMSFYPGGGERQSEMIAPVESVQQLQRKITEKIVERASRLSSALEGDLHVAGENVQSEIPFQPVTLVWDNLWYTVTVDVAPMGKREGGRQAHTTQLELLKSVSGFAKPGQMTALMGSSGAGKTTLMDVIAGRKTSGEIRGSIMVNGHPQHMKTFSRISGYVEQTDIHSPMTTVREAVRFSTRLRLSESVSLRIKNAFAEEIMSTLELSPIADQIVGTLNGGGLSVEQRKRLTIAVELGANPSVLFLDEPTSGLDARAAIIVLQSVREIAYTGRSVMCTIHQPSTFLFQMFDQLLLLKRGGETVFFGELGHKCCHLISYFQQYPDTHRIEDGANPATWMLEVIGAGSKLPTLTLTLYLPRTLMQEQAPLPMWTTLLSIVRPVCNPLTSTNCSGSWSPPNPPRYHSRVRLPRVTPRSSVSCTSSIVTFTTAPRRTTSHASSSVSS
jgi:ABC-type multidrug transport system ATPase subunit